mgnify:CR=1 FL=1
MSDLGNKEIFSKNLKYYMTINNKTRNDVCNDLGFKYTTFTDWYNGNIYPRIDKIEMLSNYFRIEKSDLIEKKSNSEPPINKIPILGTVKAGYDWLAEENIVDYITVKESIPNVKEYYALKITGDSMLPLLSEGDLVIVHDQDDVESGQTAVILINGDEATVKKVIKTTDGIELHAMNPYYPIRKFTFQEMKTVPVKIIGRVKEAKIKGAFE